MIDNGLVQEAIVAKLQADSALGVFLTGTSAAGEIRENQWWGLDFVYPAIRVDLVDQTEEGNPPCLSSLAFNVFCFSESDNSRQADRLAGLVKDALLRQSFAGSGFTSGIVVMDALTPAQRTGERVWEALAQFRAGLWGGI